MFNVYTVTIFDETLLSLEDHGTVCSRVQEPYIITYFYRDHSLFKCQGVGLKSRGVMNFHGASRGGGLPLTLTSQQWVSCFNCSNKIIKNFPRSLFIN